MFDDLHGCSYPLVMISASHMAGQIGQTWGEPWEMTRQRGSAQPQQQSEVSARDVCGFGRLKVGESCSPLQVAKLRDVNSCSLSCSLN